MDIHSSRERFAALDASQTPLERASKAQHEAQSQIAILVTEVAVLHKEGSMLKQQLADAKADVKQRLEQLEVKLADAEMAKRELIQGSFSLAEQLAEKERELDAEKLHRANVLEKAEAALTEAHQSSEEAEKALVALKGLEKAEQQLQAELAAGKSQVTLLEKETSMLKQQLADAKALGQKRLEQLEAKLSDVEKVLDVEHALTAQLAEKQREVDEERGHRAAAVQQAQAALTEAHQSTLKGLEKAGHQLQAELEAGKSQVIVLEKETSMLKQQLADAKSDGQKRLEEFDKIEKSLQANLAAQQSQIAVLEKEVSMLRQQLADAKADGKQQQEQLEAKLAGAVRPRCRCGASADARKLAQQRWMDCAGTRRPAVGG